MQNAPFAKARGLAALVLAVALSLLVAGCGRPPDDVLRDGIRANVKRQSLYNFAVSADVESHKVTRTYKQGGGVVYEFDAKVRVQQGGTVQVVTVSGRQFFQKTNGRWITESL